MQNKKRFFNNQRGGMMLEIMLSLAIATAALPFIFRELSGRINRAENVKIAHDISVTKDALERYMDAHKRELLAPTGRFVTRVHMRDLLEYGNIPKDYDKFQARIIKSKDVGGRSVLSGMVIFDSADISPMRTREIASMGGESAGFVDKSETYGAFGTWRSRTSIFDIGFGKDSIVGSTGTVLSGRSFLWRMPSPDLVDASMETDLSMGGYDINETASADVYSADFTEILKSNLISARKVQITPRANWDSGLNVSGESLVIGSLTSDSRNAEISGELYLNDTARLSRLDANELWVGDLNLNGLYISSSDEPAILKVSETIDITRGRITAGVATIGYVGSVAPKIIVNNRIEDASNTDYYWDLDLGQGKAFDFSLGQLKQMINDAIVAESVKPKTTAETIISGVAANSNASVSDYVRALDEIRTKVIAKYNHLNLEQGAVE